MNRIASALLCVVLCLTSTHVPAVSAAVILDPLPDDTVVQLLRTVDDRAPASAETLHEMRSTELPAVVPVTAQTSMQSIPQSVSRTNPQASLVRPFPAPVTTRTVAVPSSIDATGSSDVSAALMDFIASVPDGSLITFDSSSIYRIDRAVDFTHRHNLIIDGNNCTMKYVAITGTTEEYSLWRDMGGGSDIWIRDFVLIGSSPYPGVFKPGTSPTGGEWQYGVMAESDRFEVSGCTISAVWGDGLHVTGFHDVLGYYSTHTPTDIWFHDNHVISAGRNGLSVIQGKNVIAERNAFDKVGFDTFDVEPNWYFESATDIIFRSNTAGTFGSVFFGLAGSHTASLLDNITVDSNVVTHGSLKTLVDSGGAARMTRVVFTNNTGKRSASGPVLQFMHTDDLTVAGNVQPVTSGALMSTTNCTAVNMPAVRLMTYAPSADVPSPALSAASSRILIDTQP